MAESRIIADVRLETVPRAVRPSEAESFNLSWSEKDRSGSWGFHCKNLPKEEGIKLVGLVPMAPEIFRAMAGGPRYAFVLGRL